MPTDLPFAAVADDFTGGSDLAGMLHERGVRTMLCFGTLAHGDVSFWAGYNALVVCLKTRSVEPEEAVRQSLEAANALHAAGARQLQFKYCSTFDSTERGNIGPVTAALMELLQINFTIAVPALPVNGRTQYMGHLFVNGQLLSESPMRHHPLNPMTDSNLVRHLQAQTSLRAGLIDLQTVRQGADAIRDQSRQLAASGVAIALVDATGQQDLQAIAAAVADMPLITGGSGLGMALPAHWELAQPDTDFPSVRIPGPALILSGSCSAATLAQLRHLQGTGAAVSYGVRFETLATEPETEQDRLVQLAEEGLAGGASVCIYSSADAHTRAQTLDSLRRTGSDMSRISERLEETFGAIAHRLVRAGVVRKIIVAGGETSGAVVNALGIRATEVVSVLDPGVPALRTLQPQPVLLALKSGNFGSEDFFTKTLVQWEIAET